MSCIPPDSSVHGLLQTGILEGVAIPFSRESSQHRDGTQVSQLQADSIYIILGVAYKIDIYHLHV